MYMFYLVTPQSPFLLSIPTPILLLLFLPVGFYTSHPLQSKFLASIFLTNQAIYDLELTVKNKANKQAQQFECDVDKRNITGA